MPMIVQAQDIDAIAEFFQKTTPQTAEAKAIKAEFEVWFATIGTLEKHFDPVIYDRARNFRNRFIRANAVTPEQLAQVEEVISRGMTTEEMQGELRRLPGSGYYPHGTTVAERVGEGLATLAVVGVAVLVGVVALRRLIK